MSRSCIVIGSARCVWDDYDAAVQRCDGSFDVMAINDIGMHYPGELRHWYSNDAVMLERWSKARRPGLNRVPHLHTNNGAGTFVPDGMRFWMWVHGNSGVNAVLTALALGYDRVYVCGVPLDDSGHYFDPPWVVTSYDNNAALDEWMRYAVNWRGLVYSMSGNTRRILEGI